MNKAVKNKYLLVILAVALFIPTIIAIANFSKAKNGPADSKSIVELTMCDLDNKKTVLNKDSEDGEKIIGIFVEMNDTATPVGALPDPLRDKPYYLINMSNGSIEYTYQYFFDPSGTETYFMDGNGNTFMVADASAVKFLSTPYAASIFKDSSVPVFSIATDIPEVRPTEAKWAYKDANGSLINMDCSAMMTEEQIVYDVSGGFIANFDIVPDFLHVEVNNASDNAPLYSGDYENGASFTFESSAQALVTVVAKWYPDDSRGYEGEMTYSFGVEVADPAAFYLGTQTVENGEFVSVTGINVADPSKVVFASDPDIGYTPKFYKDGDKARAIIPIPIENDVGGTYKFTFNYGGVSQDISLVVTRRESYYTPGLVYDVDDATAALYSDETLKEAENALKPILSQGSEEMFFDGGFFSQLFDGGIIRFYGKTYSVMPGAAQYRQMGIEYKADEGTDVKAAARGKVVYVGELTLTGKVVVIEHGYGLKTLYAHLGNAAVSVGDIVEKDSVIGTCGKTGFTDTAGVYYATFVGNVSVSPYNMWDDGNWKTFQNP